MSTAEQPRISAAQCRAARAMLNWSREQLADVSSVHLRTIVDFEREARQPRSTTLTALASALDDAGITFLKDQGSGAGLRYKSIS